MLPIVSQFKKSANILLFLIGCAIPGGIYADDPASESTIELVEEIAQSLEGIVDQVEAPSTQTHAIDERRASVSLSELKHLIEDVRRLGSMLSSEKSLMQTRPMYRSISARRKNIQFFSDGIDIQDSIRTQARSAGVLLDKLAEIYK